MKISRRLVKKTLDLFSTKPWLFLKRSNLAETMTSISSTAFVKIFRIFSNLKKRQVIRQSLCHYLDAIILHLLQIRQSNRPFYAQVSNTSYTITLLLHFLTPFTFAKSAEMTNFALDLRMRTDLAACNLSKKC